MTDQERLAEIKAQYHILTRNGYDLGTWDEPFSWLIERVQKLEDIIYQDARQNVLEGLYEENKHYREALEYIADNKIEHGWHLKAVNCVVRARKALEGTE